MHRLLASVLLVGCPTPTEEPPALPIEPVSACAPTIDACAAPTVDGVWASYRKDHYFDDVVYDEYTDPPLDGGRVHAWGRALVGGTVTAVAIDGLDPEAIYAPPDPTARPAFDWWHIWPRELVAGEPFLVSFHARDPAWDDVDQAALFVETDVGIAFDGSFPVVQTPVPITYVTFEQGRAFVHLRNEGASPATLTQLVLNGRDVTEVACIGDPDLAPGEATLITVDLCDPPAPGDLWTAAAAFEGAPSAANGGRVLRPFFPIEAWNNTTECPWPGANDVHAEAYAAAGIDTHYLHGGVCNNCGCETGTLIEDVYGADPTLHTIITDDVAAATHPLATTAGVAAVSTGDESDGQYVEDDPGSEDHGVPIPAIKARKARESWARTPELPVFNGGLTNGHVGAFAGMTDVQGMDVYIGACAPHITRFGTHPPVRMPFDYLRNARNNHRPLPTWGYAQGLSPVGAWTGQPVPSEILVQGAMTLASGAKGLMWFQANQEAAAEHPESWAAMAQINALTGALRSRLLTGDPTGAARSTGDVLIEAIRAQDAILVIAVQLETTQAPSDIDCLVDQRPHVFASTVARLEVDLPPDLGVVDVFELRPEGIVEPSEGQLRGEGRTLTIDSVSLSDGWPIAVWILAADAGVRADVEAALSR